jgi:hypothetical protein
LRYDIPRQIAQEWVTTDQILPLLDGLDEVSLEHRVGCVESINLYRDRRVRMLSSLVVTSRVADYDPLKARLRLRGAVLLQPLSPEQIDAYLASAGRQLAGVRTALEADATLQEMAASPLLLSIMTLAYQGASDADLPTSGSTDERRTQLFDTYADQMFKRRAAAIGYTRAQTLQWLGWLASALSQQDQTVFYLERLQPEWLPTKTLRSWYAVIDRLGGGLVVGVLAGLVFALAVLVAVEPDTGPTPGLVFGLVAAVLVGVFNAPSNAERSTTTGRPTAMSLLPRWNLNLGRRLAIQLPTAWIRNSNSNRWFFGLLGEPSLAPRHIAVVEPSTGQSREFGPAQESCWLGQR